MILSFINIPKVPREVLKTLGFQHLPRDLANVNEWKIMFDPYIAQVLFTLGFSYITPTNHSSQDRTNYISGKVHAHLSNCSMCRKINLNVTKQHFYILHKYFSEKIIH